MEHRVHTVYRRVRTRGIGQIPHNNLTSATRPHPRLMLSQPDQRTHTNATPATAGTRTALARLVDLSLADLRTDPVGRTSAYLP